MLQVVVGDARSLRDAGEAGEAAIQSEEFRQGRENAAEGTGLGLPLSRKLIELHGGRLWLETTGGSGSTFRFVLPAEAAGAG